MLNQHKYDEINQTIADNHTDLYTLLNIKLVLNELEENNHIEGMITCEYDKNEVIKYLTSNTCPYLTNVQVPYILKHETINHIIEILIENGLVAIY